MSLEGWKEDGEGLIKWFGDHWKHAASEDAAAELDREAALRNPEPTPNLVGSVSEVWQAPAPRPDASWGTDAPASEAPAETPQVEATAEAGTTPAADASEADNTDNKEQ